MMTGEDIASVDDGGESLGIPVAQPLRVSEDENRVEAGYTVADPNGPVPGGDGGENESLLAGKFKSQEDLVKAYKELESKLGQRDVQQEPTKPERVPEAERVAGLETTDEATSTLKERGLDINVFQAEFERTGTLSEESYAALTSKGIPRDMVDAYISGQRTLVASQISEVKSVVGGESEYAKLCQWAAASLPKRDQDAYERILATSDISAIKLAVAGLRARYEDAMGKDPSISIGGNASARNDGLERFASAAEMVQAMRDSRYESDPAYRAKVERRVYNSNF